MSICLLNSFMQRWFVDGSVNCFTGGHLPLVIMAILILMLYMLLIIFVTAVVFKKIKVIAYQSIYIHYTIINCVSCLSLE